jgi:hypothetical protein
MKKSRLLGAMCAAAFTFISILSQAALIDNGGGLIYDNVLKITWAQPDTFRNWDDANTWADGLTLGGAENWRLPYISVDAGAGPFTGSPIDCSTASESDCQDNELGYMFYQNLGGTGSSSLFPTLPQAGYWSGTEVDSTHAWYFSFAAASFGDQDSITTDLNVHTWAVHAGNIGAVPIPPAVWLFCSGLLGLVGLARRKA